MNKIEGYAYLLGDDINTDDIVPSEALTLRDTNEMVMYTLKYVDTNFVENVKKHNIIIAGENFGTGSSREEAVNVFKILNVKAIIAKSFARIYFRNLINLGIPGIQFIWDKDDFSHGDSIEIVLDKGDILNKTKKRRMEFQKLPLFLSDILEDGGILNQIKKTL
ncbi:MAG: LeuD/DmdB family oxidoreductase small subunit [Promethearchaeota archaeon]|jgi:3-isopropylmalate/(R)-2-methylmalate dehydratase small subunit